MAYTITSESYGRRLPKITATADSTDDLAALGTNYAEGSTVNVGGTTYSLDKVSGWIIPGSGGEGGGAFIIHYYPDEETPIAESYADILAAVAAGKSIAVWTDNGTAIGAYSTTWHYVPDSATPVRINANELIPGGEGDEYWITYNGVDIVLTAEGETVTATPWGLYFSANIDD